MRLIYCGLASGRWNAKHVEFFPQNLIVGKNAVGKSTLIKSLANIATILSQRILLNGQNYVGGMIAIEDDDFVVAYRFQWKDAKVWDEHLSVLYQDQDKKSDRTPEVWIERTIDEAKFKGMIVNPPHDKLLLNMKRDVVRYPEIESIVSWAENVDAFSFNKFDIDGDEKLFSRYIDRGDNLYSMVKSLNHDSIEHVVEMAEYMGYHLEKIEPIEFADIKKVLFIERGVSEPLFDFDLSDGMFRTLYLLIYLEYVVKSGKPATLLIDDLCEGLDYDRSTKLGKYVFEFCSKNDIQLIATSNDSLLMDIVDLNYWSILQRDGSKVSAINHMNHPELFEDFSFTGLSNFDLLSSDFIARHNKKK